MVALKFHRTKSTEVPADVKEMSDWLRKLEGKHLLIGNKEMFDDWREIHGIAINCQSIIENPFLPATTIAVWDGKEILFVMNMQPRG